MENLFRIFMESTISPIWIKDINLNFLFVNDAFAKFSNRNKEEIIGFKNEDIFEGYLVEKFNEICNKVIKTGELIIDGFFENGEYKECSISPLKDKDGKLLGVSGIIGILSDATTIKKKELEIQNQKNITHQIIDILPGVVFYKDKDKKYIYANKECREHYKAIGIENILGKTDDEINFDKVQVEKFSADDNFILKHKKAIHNEVVFNLPDGRRNFREVVKIPILNKNGDAIGIVGRSLDITDKKLYQEKLEYLSYTDILTGVKNRAAFEECEIEYSKPKYMPVGVIMGDANGLKLINDTLGHNEGDKFLIEIASILNQVTEYDVFRIGGDEFVILIPNTTMKECEELVLEILKECKKYKSELFNISISLGTAIKKDLEQDIYEVLKEAEDKVYRQKLLQYQSMKSSILNSLKLGFAVSIEETEQHAERVARTAIKVGKRLDLEISKLDELRIAANFHDIGKIGISEDILLKPGKLTEEEYKIIQSHSEKGYRIIKASSELQSVAETVLHHHERWDGKGYPSKLKEEEIPLLSRIISICDSYDVMINDRIYKKAMTKEKAIEELKNYAGIQFDPNIVKVFIDIIQKEY